MVQEAQHIMEELTIVKEGRFGELPSIPWSQIEDDTSQQQPRYWFLANTHNKWARLDDNYILEQIIQDRQH